MLQYILLFCNDLSVSFKTVALLTDSLSSVKNLVKRVQRDQKILGIYIHDLKQSQQGSDLLILLIKRHVNLADLETKQPSTIFFDYLVLCGNHLPRDKWF